MIGLRTIPRFENYAVTKDGRVWSKPRKDRLGRPCGGKWLKCGPNQYGHLWLRLSKNGKTYQKFIHRLVLETFVGTCSDGMECRHLDGNPKNNCLGNLKWGTKAENRQDMIQHGNSTRGSKCFQSKLTSKKVITMRYLRNVAKFLIKDLAWHFDVSSSTVSKICSGKLWGHIN